MRRYARCIMARITISVPCETVRALKKKSAAQHRSVSSYVKLLLEADLRDAGVVAQAPAVLLDKHIAHALAELQRMEIDPVVHLEAILADATANHPTAAA